MRSTIPAPPPNGTSSTLPAFSGVVARGSTASSAWPSASALATWRWVRNQSNQCGKSVKTSIRTEEPQVDVDAPGRDVDRAHGVADHRHEQLLAAVADDLEHLDRGQLDHPAHRADLALTIGHRTALELVRPVLAGLQRRGVGERHPERPPVQALGRLARLAPTQADHRALVRAGPADDLAEVGGRAEGEQPGARARDVEGAVEAVGAPDAPRLEEARHGATPRCRAGRGGCPLPRRP